MLKLIFENRKPITQTIFEIRSPYSLHIRPAEVIQIPLFYIIRTHKKRRVPVLEPNLFGAIQRHPVQSRVSTVQGHFLEGESVPFQLDFYHPKKRSLIEVDPLDTKGLVNWSIGGVVDSVHVIRTFKSRIICLTVYVNSSDLKMSLKG